MADEHRTDILMKFVRKDNSAVNSECALDKDKGDKLMWDFTPQTYDSFSNFFEIQNFSFGFEVKDESDSETQGIAKKANEPKKDKLVAGDFVSWRTGTDEQARKVLLPLEFRSFKFERLIDSASAVFLEHVVTSKSFASATLIKRVAVGEESVALAYLRLDFQDVLITSLDWDDGELTKEKCEFICRQFEMQYSQQKFDGSLDQAIKQVKWTPELTK